MSRDSFHPLRLLPVLGAAPRDRSSLLEPAIEQWFTEDFRTHDDPSVDFETDLSPRSREGRREPVEEAISWSIVPNAGRKIPESGQ